MSLVTRAPSRADAERVAELFTLAGVSAVWLFGSTARGEATESSDIDLVAIYDDLDYTARFTREQELARLATAEVGYPVDVLVTDRPEWKVRTENIVTSLESWIAGYGVLLVDHGIGEVDWDKEMVLPTNSHEATMRRLREVSGALIALEMFLRPNDRELKARRSGDYEEALYLLVVRFEGACGQIQRTVESAIKSLVHVAGCERAIRGHDIAELCAQLVEPYRGEISARLARVGFEELTRWHQDSRYTPDSPMEPPTSGEVRTMAEVACEVASYAVDQLQAPGWEASHVRAAIAEVERRLGGYHLESGKPRH